MQVARVSILRAEKENGYLDVTSLLGPAFVWERSANVPPPGLTKAEHGCCESLSSTNVQHLRATARFSSHCTEVCKVASLVSRRCASHSPQQSSHIRAIYQSHERIMGGGRSIPIRLSSEPSTCSGIFIGQRRPAQGRPGRPGLISMRGVFQDGAM